MFKAMLAAVAMFAAGTAQAAWQEASSKHFVVYSEDSADKVRQLTTRLENFDGALRVLLGAPDPEISPSARVTVYVARDIDAVQRLVGRGGGNVAGFYLPRASGSVAFVPRDSMESDGFTPLVVMFHEYAHHVMFSAWGDAATPAWLIEGFAEFTATARTRPDGGVVVGAAPRFRGEGMLDYQQMPIRRLLTSSTGGMTGLESSVFYSRAWLLTHYLLLDGARRRQFTDYLGAVNGGKSGLDAAAPLGPLPALEAALNDYANKPRLNGFLIPADKLPPAGEVRVRALTPGEAAVMPARIVSTRGVDARTAPEVAALARRLAGPFPADPTAQVVLAEAEYDAGQYVAAEAAATRALAADARHVRALIYQGMARMAAARKDKVTDPARWKAIRASFSQANRLDPENPWPLQLFFQSFGAAGQRATSNAADGLIYAHALAPFDAGLGLTAAHIELERGKADNARALLRPIAFRPHGGGPAKLATRVLAGIDANGAAGGLTAFDTPDVAAAAGAAEREE